MADDLSTTLKTCPKCQKSKLRSEFWRDRRKRDGLTSSCIDCAKESHAKWCARNVDYQKDWRVKNRAKANANAARWRARNPETVRELERKRWAKNPDRERARTARWWANNPEKARIYAAAWRAKNPEKCVVISAKWRMTNGHIKLRWRMANKDRARAYDAKRRSSPRGRLDDAVSVGIRQSLKAGSKAGRRWEAVVGYSLDALMAHLESLFLPGMTWANYGEWHVDHRIPKSAHNYSSPDHLDFKRAWALTNLQPMWAVENIRKGAKLNAPFQPSLAL